MRNFGREGGNVTLTNQGEGTKGKTPVKRTLETCCRGWEGASTELLEKNRKTTGPKGGMDYSKMAYKKGAKEKELAKIENGEP